MVFRINKKPIHIAIIWGNFVVSYEKRNIIIRQHEEFSELSEVKNMSMIGQEASGNIIKGKEGIIVVPTVCPDCLTPHVLMFNSYLEVECDNCHIILE